MGLKMDRRQRKTREAIFKAFSELLSKKDYNRITVSEIIERANVGRATFYAHFETRDFLLKELCQELFCHIFDSINGKTHNHIFCCDAPNSAFLHILQHLQRNDNGLLELMRCENNELFLKYFKENLKELVKKQRFLFDDRKSAEIPEDFWINHVCSTFVETVRWWLENGMKESPEEITEYFIAVIL